MLPKMFSKLQISRMSPESGRNGLTFRKNVVNFKKSSVIGLQERTFRWIRDKI